MNTNMYYKKFLIASLISLWSCSGWSMLQIGHSPTIQFNIADASDPVLASFGVHLINQQKYPINKNKVFTRRAAVVFTLQGYDKSRQFIELSPFEKSSIQSSSFGRKTIEIHPQALTHTITLTGIHPNPRKSYSYGSYSYGSYPVLLTLLFENRYQRPNTLIFEGNVSAKLYAKLMRPCTGAIFAKFSLEELYMGDMGGTTAS